MRRLFVVVTCAALFACGGKSVNTDGGVTPPSPAHTTVSPDPGPFNGSVAVSLTTDIPATVFVTTDGSDPTVETANRKSGPSPLALELTATTTLKYFSRTAEGADEPVSSATFVRAGAAKGTISGVVVVDTLAVGKAVALSVNGQQQTLPTPTTPKELPFKLENQQSGTYRLSAISDRDGDGNFLPVLDLSSDTVTVTLDLNDPFKASAENVHLFLGASADGFGTLKGTITFSKPPSGQSLSIAALSPDLLGAGTDPQALLGALQSGYQIFTNGTDLTYPYVITDLKPGTYVPVAILSGFGNGGVSMNFQANPLRPVSLAANETKTKDFTFGGVGLSGTATYTPAPATDGGTTDGGVPNFAYGVVAAKSFNLNDGLEAVMMPTIFSPDGQGALMGAYGGSALRENSTFALRAFPSTSAQNPLVASLGWIVATLGAPPPHATVSTGTTDVVVDFTFQP